MRPVRPVAATVSNEGLKMKRSIFLAITVAFSVSHAYSMTCPEGTSKAIVKHDVIGAISLDSLKEIDPRSDQSLQNALANHTAQAITGGTVVCAAPQGAAGFFEYARRLYIPALDVDMWVSDHPSDEFLAPADDGLAHDRRWSESTDRNWRCAYACSFTDR
uniref:Uncharacterized protein n=2 Tax=Burkholderia sp. M701 TaxID=326454 RepID=V5YMT6_9BURK|nr:hypothetical protein [Burkholderia sp. M701]